MSNSRYHLCRTLLPFPYARDTTIVKEILLTCYGEIQYDTILIMMLSTSYGQHTLQQWISKVIKESERK